MTEVPIQETRRPPLSSLPTVSVHTDGSRVAAPPTKYTANNADSEGGLNTGPLTSVLEKTPDVAKVLEKTPMSLAKNPSFTKVLKMNPSYGKAMSKDSILIHTLEKNPGLVKSFADPKFSKQFETLRSNEHVISSMKNNPALSNLKSVLSRKPSGLTETKAKKIGLYASKSTSFRWIDDEEDLLLAYGILVIATIVIIAVGYSKMQ